ncbi:MAG: hypothetical protein J1E07_04225 [Treponema sp.]|nr:hypothetical protein [Treponema sp.]
MQDLDEESREIRKKQQIEYRNRRKVSTIFMFVATLFEILETLLLMLALFALDALIMLRLFNPENQSVQIAFQVSIVVIFIGGLVGGFLIYKNIVRWVIKKFSLEKVLLDDVVRHYIKPSQDEMEQQLRR